MRKSILKFVFMLSFILCAFFAFSITSSAETYEPDGTTSTQYEYASGDCNRTIAVTCVDENGKLLKKVNVRTKHGADKVCYISIYNYNPIAFSSDQGLWETCKLVWTSGGTHCAGDIDIDYYFRTGMSKKTINVTVKMRPFDEITIRECFYKEKRIGTNGSTRQDILADIKTTTLYCGDYFSTSAKRYTGYTLNSEYFSSLSGYWSMSMFGKPKNMGSVLNSMKYDVVHETWEMDGKNYPRWTTYDESKDGKLGHIENRVITIEYKYDVDWCTFTFNANGGSGAPEAVSQWYDHDVTIPNTFPTRDGYTFKGWGTYAADTSASYLPGQTTTMGTTKTLYAIWDVNKYTISYNANGGNEAPSAQTKKHGTAINLRFTEPTRVGYNFLGWSERPNAVSAEYSSGAAFTKNASITLYAVWEKITYTVSYSSNGGSGAPSSQIKTHGIALTLSDTKPIRAGYTFLGWSTSRYAMTASYISGGTYTEDKSTILYAVWDKNVYTISYDANGGSGAPMNQTKKHGDIFYLSRTKPKRNGYTFAGWGVSPDATVSVYNEGQMYLANESITLYAVWKPIPVETYTVSYNANGGSGELLSQTKTKDVTLTLSSEIPKRSRYTFLGWSTSSTATSPEYYAGDSYTENKSIDLYAVWLHDAPEVEPVITYTVSYNAKGGIGAPSPQIKTEDIPLTLSEQRPISAGYAFLGWSTSPNASSPEYYAGGSYTANESIVLYAVWLPVPPLTYTISFDANGGTGAPEPVIKTDGVAIYLPEQIPTRVNYMFVGWNTSSTAPTAAYSAGESFNKEGNTTLYAVWLYAPERYPVSYDANGGTGAPDEQIKVYGFELTLSSLKPTRSGYDFQGWATDINAASAEYAPGDVYRENNSVVLYAVWSQINYDFSISDLSVSDSDPHKYDQITVKLRADNWDKVNAYSNITVELIYDGIIVSTKNVNFTAYGVANITFTLNVGGLSGSKVIEARINWQNHDKETRTSNNAVSTTITVWEHDYEMSVDTVIPEADYTVGDEVITTFKVYNDSRQDILPSHNGTAKFTAYYYNGSQKVIISSQEWNQVVIPANEVNIVYFKWSVPSDIAGKTVYCECTVQADFSIHEQNKDNNTAAYSTAVLPFTESQTPNTRYENTQPVSYKGYHAPANSTEKATWNMWIYEDGVLVLKEYGVQISTVSPVVSPSSDCKTAVYENGKWTIRSGYGFTMSYTPSVTIVNGYINPGSSAYTSVQSVYAAFPEFNYATTNGNCRTLQYVNGKWQFVQNNNAVDKERVHFIPVWFTDGNYTVSVTASRVWTPAGMISATRTANTLNIDGSIFDDYYVGN